MAVLLKEITVAHSPDSDDAFMFYGLAKGKIDTSGLTIKQVMKDIQSLNQDALSGKYEVSAISFAAYPAIADRYALLPTGSSMGLNYGPVVVSAKPLNLDQLANAVIAIPGEMTSAFLALRLCTTVGRTRVLPFNQILEAVKAGEVDAGLIIHEGQLTFGQEGLHKVVDLGEWFYEKTQLPLPLGGNAIRKDLGPELMARTNKLLQKSIVYSLENRKEALEYAMTFARDMAANLADKFVGMYVNELTVDFGQSGRSAIEKLFEMAHQKGLISKPLELVIVE